MRKIITLSAAILATSIAFSQAPNKISYQAVIRNSSNTLVTNQAVGMRISILQGSVNGTAVYVETQTKTTNTNGLVTLEIGGGTPVQGTFAAINWASGTYFVKTETDPTGGSNYTISGTSQLLSVPYALSARRASGIEPNTEIQLRNTQDNSSLYITPPGGGSTGGIGTSTNHGLYFFTNNVDRVVFTPTGKYGFGTTNPSSLLHLSDPNAEIRLQNSDINSSIYITAPANGATGGIGTSSNHGLYFFTNNVDRVVFTPTGRFGFGTTNPSSMFHLSDPNAEIRLQNSTSNASLYLTAPGQGSTGGIGTSTNHGLYFFTNNVDRAVFTPNGRFGFGTTNPPSTVSVQGGDVNVMDVGAGIILKSPNGNCWRVTVDNNGNFVSTAITCP